jgi:serine/threonine-protein kinase
MLQPGSQIGRYEIQRRLGRGGMGTVYVAHDPVLGRLVAIKVFATDLDLPDAAQRFAREARSAAALNHPHIVTVHDFGDVESQPFIVMEYVQGDTLADIIRRKAPVSLTDKLRWLEELCSGAAYAHRSGVLHRDIKPTNLMINRSGQLKILDFGIARMIGTLSPKATALVGTPGYMAPEQILGEAIDHRADLFSIGVVCYELLAYTEAFPGETLPTITHRILTQDPVPLAQLVPTVHPELIALVDRALRKNPTERFDDVEALKTALSRIRRQLENDSAWDAAAPTVIVERPGAGVSKRGTGSMRQPVPDSVSVAELTPPPDPQRLDREAIARRRTEQIEAGLDRSRRLLEAGDANAALEACAQALTIDATNSAALQLEQTIQGVLTAKRADALRQEAAGQLGRHSLTSAQDLLQQARDLDPENPELKRLEKELRLARVEQTRRRQRAEQLSAALARAEEALTRGETEAALAFARDAIGLDSESARARELEAEALRRLDEETSPHKFLPVTDPGGAATIALPPEGDAPTVLTTRASAARVPEASADSAPTIIARKAAPDHKPASVTPGRPAPSAGDAKASPSVTGRGGAPAPATRKSAPPQTAPRRDPLAGVRETLTRSVASVGTMWHARSKQERAIIVSGALVVAAAVVIAVVIALRPPSVIPTGTVAIDAVPWATVTRIEAADGTAQQLPPQASTPLLLTLPAGTYRITLVGPPPDSESRVATVEVRADGAAVVPAERFRTMTPEDYFEQYLTSATSAPADGTPAGGAAPADPAGPSSGPSTAPASGAPR